MQATDIDQARYLYDQFIPVAPIMLALTAASPVFRGLLADVDVRWNVISQRYVFSLPMCLCVCVRLCVIVFFVRVCAFVGDRRVAGLPRPPR